METKIVECPKCHQKMEIEANRTKLFCSYCGTMINLAADVDDSVSFQETRFETQQGQVVGYAEVPQGWHVEADLQKMAVDDLTPFSTTLNAASEDGTMQVGNRTGENLYTHRTKNIWAQLGAQPHVEYLVPDDYLLAIAKKICGTTVTLVKSDTLQTGYLANITNESNKILARFEENGNIVLPSIQMHLTLTNAMFDSRMVEAECKGRNGDMAVFVGGDLFGLEYYDRASASSIARNLTGGIGSLVSKAKEAMDDNDESIDLGWFMRGGIVGSMLRQHNKASETPVQKQAPKQEQKQGEAPFGFAHEYGKPVDTINWGSKRLYYAIGPKEKEGELEQVFRRMARTYRMDQSLLNFLEQYHQQVRQQEIAQLNGATGYAFQSQMMNNQRLQHISQTLSQSSNIVMQGYQDRQAANDRMSQKRSEAIRGVNTYVKGDGSTAEHSVSSDHVYENKYGDTVGVSGNAIDDSLAARLGLKEIFKK